MLSDLMKDPIPSATYQRIWMEDLYTKFLSSLVRSGEVVYDVGAGYGYVTQILLRLGCRVVAVEPRPEPLAFLQGTLHHAIIPGRAFLVGAGVGGTHGDYKMLVPDKYDEFSTYSMDYYDLIAKQYPDLVWEELTTPMTRLSMLQERFGQPVFLYLDVEGTEPSVLGSMGEPIQLVSFEFYPALPEHLTRCVGVLDTFGKYVYNYLSNGHKWALDDWCESSEFLAEAEDLPLEIRGDLRQRVFARLTEVPKVETTEERHARALREMLERSMADAKRGR